ncbi:S49 family peptidase [Lutibaculum baratangense]|nr:S49 family peptidase [Lutibaculum baratangense]
MSALFGRLGLGKPVVPTVTLSGPIGVASPLRPGVTLAAVSGALERAFRYKRGVAVAIRINSPGGSPVQSRLIYSRIRTLAERHKKKVHVFIEDVGASGGYLVALAGDEIIADSSSIVGSIGVVAAGFGFDKLIERVGIERRVYTSGPRKVMLDPFQPTKDEDVERLRAIQADIQQMFVDLVRERRAGKLTVPDEDLFTGEFWSGHRAHDLGLVDTLGDLRQTMQDRYGEDIRIVPVSTQRGFLSRRMGPFRDGGLTADPSFAEDLVATLETRAMWSRYGI